MQQCTLYHPIGDGSVEKARDDYWDWFEAADQVVDAAPDEEDNDTAYTECSSLISEFGR